MAFFYFPALLSYQRFTSSTTGTMSLLPSGGLNPPLPPPKGNQIGVSGSGRMSKANYLTHSTIHVAFIVSFKRPAAVYFLALNFFASSPPSKDLPVSTGTISSGENFALSYLAKQSSAPRRAACGQQAMSKSNN